MRYIARAHALAFLHKGFGMNDKLTMGSLLFRSKGIVEHVGIYLGFGKVIHTVPDTGVAVVDIKEFGDGKVIRIVGTDELDVETLSARINEVFAGDTDYSLSSNNCQHIANYILTGGKQSPQLRWTLTVALIAGCFALYRKQNPLPYLALGGIIGCLGYSISLEFDGVLTPSTSG